jgi:MOSC domain-containing protein YiiM
MCQEYSIMEKIRSLGVVKQVQIQPERMIVHTPEGLTFDPTHRLAADCLTVTPEGISVNLPGGETILDVHHRDHPAGRHKPDNAVSISFSAHYREMQARFGAHMVDGSAGENILIDFKDEVWLDDLGKLLLFENPETGETALLAVNRIAAPCEPFTHFAADSQDRPLPSEELKEHLQFLGAGRRGFLLSLHPSQTQAFIRPGDQVFVLEIG